MYFFYASIMCAFVFTMSTRDRYLDKCGYCSADVWYFRTFFVGVRMKSHGSVVWRG